MVVLVKKGAKKSLIKTTTDLKGVRAQRHEHNIEFSFFLHKHISFPIGNKKIRVKISPTYGFTSTRILIRKYLILSVVPKTLYHKIDLSPNPVFQRWRAYLKRWSVFPSLSPSISERTAHCRKKLYDNKTLNKPFCFPLCKTTSGKRKKLSYKRKNIR